MPNNMPRNPLLCSFASFSIILLVPLIKKPYSSKDLTIFMTFVISSFQITNAVRRCAKSPGRLNPSGIKALLANGLSTFFNNDKAVLIVEEVYQDIHLIVSF